MKISAIDQGCSAACSARSAPGLLSCKSVVRRVVPLAGAAALIVLASACASMAPRQASATGVRPRHTTAPALAASRPAPAATASVPVPAASPATGYTGPHFTTPRAAMTYLAAAYNNDDTTALRAVTDPQAFTSLQAMRSSDAGLRLTSCKPTPRGDYMCSFRYDYAGGHHPRPQTAMVLAAPALNPGWYMYRFLSGCD